MVDETEPEVESDLRRRAAWMLGMLVVVAVLFVVIMTQLVGGGSGGSSHNQPGALDSAVTSAPTPATSHHPSPTPTPTTHARTTTSAASSSPPARHRKSCPTKQACVLDGDIGDGVAAINAYRTQHGQPAVAGRVSSQAQQCALNNGSGCGGGWAETQVDKPNGAKAVQKILQFARLLDPNVKSFEVGWAYDPGAKQYYFAIIRND